MQLQKLFNKRKALFLLQSLFGIILLIIFLKTNDLSKIPTYFSRISITLLFFVSLIYMLAAFIRVLRFRILLTPVKKISLPDAIASSFVGALINYLIPARLGELGRGWFIKQKYGLSLVSGTTVSFIDKIFDVVAAIFLLILILPLIGNYPIRDSISIFQIFLILLFFILLYLAVFKGAVFHSLLAWAISPLPKKVSFLIITILKRAFSGLLVLKARPASLFLLILLSILALTLDGIYFYFLFLLLGFSVAPTLIILGYVVFNLSFLIPAAPGYLGNIELLGVLIFSSLLGLPKEYVLPVIIFYHVLLTLMLSISGFLSLLVLNLNWAGRYDKMS